MRDAHKECVAVDLAANPAALGLIHAPRGGAAAPERASTLRVLYGA